MTTEYLSFTQERVLQALHDLTGSWRETFVYFRTIEAETKLNRNDVRDACQDLRRRGYAEYSRGLVDWDDCRAAGSGYACTPEGAKYVADVLDQRVRPHAVADGIKP